MKKRLWVWENLDNGYVPKPSHIGGYRYTSRATLLYVFFHSFVRSLPLIAFPSKLHPRFHPSLCIVYFLPSFLPFRPSCLPSILFSVFSSTQSKRRRWCQRGRWKRCNDRLQRRPRRRRYRFHSWRRRGGLHLTLGGFPRLHGDQSGECSTKSRSRMSGRQRWVSFGRVKVA